MLLLIGIIKAMIFFIGYSYLFYGIFMDAYRLLNLLLILSSSEVHV